MEKQQERAILDSARENGVRVTRKQIAIYEKDPDLAIMMDLPTLQAQFLDWYHRLKEQISFGEYIREDVSW